MVTISQQFTSLLCFRRFHGKTAHLDGPGNEVKCVDTQGLEQGNGISDDFAAGGPARDELALPMT